ncbi:hypothetical protein [Streptomyces sp. NPDC001108]
MNAVSLQLPSGPGPVDVEGHAFTTVTDAALAGDRWDAGQFGTVLGWGGRIAGPFLLWDAVDGGLIGGETIAAYIGGIWSRAEFPDSALGHDRWRAFFGLAGYTRDGVRVPRPAEPVELWRGSVPERRADWSWTTDRATAVQYAAGSHSRPPGALYRLTAPPAALLCENNNRKEHEFVVDTAYPGLVITTDDLGIQGK